jgi:hypothetical protein
MASTTTKTILLLWGLIHFAPHSLAQDSNFQLSIPEIERILKSGAWEVTKVSTIKRLGVDSENAIYQAKKVTLLLDDGSTMQVKWKTSPGGGESFNNQPRYELAAYQFQKLFLAPADYMVPPTVGLTMPIQQYRKIDPDAIPTFDNTQSVFFVVQYWLNNVTHEGIYDETRFASDTSYARHFANMNIFSYLIKHSDSNVGNFLVSTDPTNPRVFAVDNGIAFGREHSTRGAEWKHLKVERLPKETIDRLREITLEDLEKNLGVVVQFAIVDGRLVRIDPTPNFDKGSGVREKDGLIQFGLTTNEIRGIYSRLKKLLNDIDSGKIHESYGAKSNRRDFRK